MTDVGPVLRLNLQQVAQLLAYCSEYRSYLWQHVIPTPERNQTIRNIQAVQGRLEKAQEQGQAEIALFLGEEEKATLKQLLSGITQLYGNTQSSEQRTKQLRDVTALRLQIEHTLRNTSPL